VRAKMVSLAAGGENDMAVDPEEAEALRLEGHDPDDPKVIEALRRTSLELQRYAQRLKDADGNT